MRGGKRSSSWSRGLKQVLAYPQEAWRGRWWYDRLWVKQLAWFRRRVAGGGPYGTGKLWVSGGVWGGGGGGPRGGGGGRPGAAGAPPGGAWARARRRGAARVCVLCRGP